MLDTQTFKVVIANTPLVSIDLCFVHAGQMLLGKRNNEPLKGQWFTPGGRIYKNEAWQNALLRIVEAELGLSGITVDKFLLMGVWDHFYDNSIVDPDISTHYVNLPHCIFLESVPTINTDIQHNDFRWVDLAAVSNSKEFHPHMRNYAKWIYEKMVNTHD